MLWSDLHSRVTTYEIALWIAKQRLDGPIRDGWRDDRRTALTIQHQAACAGVSLTVCDCMPGWYGEAEQEPAPQALSDEELEIKLRAALSGWKR